MTHRPAQWFHFGPWVFSIDEAAALIAASPRPIEQLPVAAWATAYGLPQLDQPIATTVSLIGPAPGTVDRVYAMTTDLTQPVLVAQIPITGQPPGPLLIDGVHRLYHAWREGVPRLPAHLLSTEETLHIRHTPFLGPDGKQILRPRS